MDAAIIAALRQSRTMAVTARLANGGRIIDSYTLPGVATAMDAAALTCARRQVTKAIAMIRKSQA